MVRETRHLWVGNLPENIREERIREHFKRYGRVQSVKLLPRGSKQCGGGIGGSGETGMLGEVDGIGGVGVVGGGIGSGGDNGGPTTEGTLACTIAFMDIKSASKAHTAEHKLEERTLTTEYYEPAAVLPATASVSASAAAAAAAAASAAAMAAATNVATGYTANTATTRFNNSHGSAEEHPGFSDRFYERGGGRVADAEYLRRTGYHDTSRGRARDRLYRNGPYTSAIIDRERDRDRERERSHRSAITSSWPYEGSSTASARYTSSQAAEPTYTTAPPLSEPPERRSSDVQLVKKKTKSRSGSRTPSPSGSTSSRSPSRSRSRSSSSSSSSSTSRGSSSPTSSPRTRNSRVQSSVSAAPPVHSEDRRPLAICVRNLPARSSDTSLKDGLFHEYKKHGKVTWVKVVGQSADRYALVCFKKPDDVDKALEVSYDKLFFGCKIEVGPYQGYDVEDNEFRPYEAELDEYHPKATRTLFIGNLEKDVTPSDLRKNFDQFGEIIEIDIKKQGAVSSYAFCQYSDIVSVVKAIRKMDGEHLGNNRIKLGFGKSMPTNCVWVDGVSERVDEKYLTMQFERYGTVTQVSLDRDRGHALIFFEQVACAQTAVKEMRGVTLRGKKLQVDFASRECQDTFYDHLEKQGIGNERPAFEASREPVQRERSFDSSTLAATNRYARYETSSRPRTSSYSSRSGTGSQCTSSAVPSPGTPGSVTPRGSSSRSRLTRYNDYYESSVDYPERRFRSYDEFSQGSGASHEDGYEHEYIYNRESPGHVEPVESRTMQSVVVTADMQSGNATFVPPDIRHLQKERVHLLEQLDECPSSGDEAMSPKKRMKLDMCDGGGNVVSDVMDVNHGDHRKVIEVRRLSDTGVKHHSRRPSIDGKHCIRGEVPIERSYMPHAVCKRRKTSGSESDRSRIHHHHDMSGSESLAGSRPGTPLCDERPENLPPSEPRRPRERANEGPLSLPLPRFAAQVLNSPRLNISVAGFKNSKENVVSSPPTAAVTSPKVMNPIPPSPVHVPPPASPPPRPPSSSNSSDSDAASPSPTLEERLRSLDEKYEKWSGSRALSAAGGDALAKLDASASERFRFRHKLLDLDLKELQPSEIVKSVLAKRSVFDEDTKRLENVGEKYEPREYAIPRTFGGPLPSGGNNNNTNSSGNVGMNTPPTPSSAVASSSPLLSPAAATVKSLANTSLSPRSSIPAAKGLQYPFPSHPPAVSTVAGNVHSDNARLKLCSSLPSDRTTSKVNLNRSGGCVAVPPSGIVSGAAVATTVLPKHRSLDKNGDSDKVNNSNIPINSCESVVSVNALTGATTCSTVNTLSGDVVTNHVGKTPPRDKSASSRKEDKTNKSDKVAGRRDSVSSSPSSVGSSKCDRSKDRREKKSDKDSDFITTEHRTVKQKDSDIDCDRKREKESDFCDRKAEEEKQKAAERLERERQEAERREREERERLEHEKQEKERLEKERLEKERLEKERLEKERLEKERLEKERLEKERLEKERLEKERQERLEKERLEREKLERERKREKEERERREREDRERREKEEQAERERIEKEKQRERERREKEERERQEREELEKERQEKELHEKLMKEKQEQRKREKEFEKHDRRHKDDNHEIKEKKKDKEDYDKQKQRENHSDNIIEVKNRHRENHIDSQKSIDRQQRDSHENRKDVKDHESSKVKDLQHDTVKNNHELQRKDSHEKNKEHHDNSRNSNDTRKEEKHSHSNELRKEESSTKNRHHIVDRDSESTKDRRKDSLKENRENIVHEKNRHFSTDSRENNKDRHSSTDSRHLSTDSEKNRSYNDHCINSTTPNRTDPNKRKEKNCTTPASVGCKRRISSQDSSESPDDSKRLKVSVEHRKISDRRDSKDSRDSNNSRSSDKTKQNKHSSKSNFTRMLEDKIREEKRNKELSEEKRKEKEREREREDRYKLKQTQKLEKQKLKSKNRESKDSKLESPGTPKSTGNKELMLDKDFLSRLDLRANDDDEKQKLQRKDSREKRKDSHESDERRNSDDVKRSDDRKKDKCSSFEKKIRDEMLSSSKNDDRNKNLQKKEITQQRIRKSTNSSDTSDSDEPKKHSIFDIVDDEPAYISMYDKVKARSCKNMQKQEEEKRQEKLKAKFTQLKQSRAKREEKKRSTSWDEDSDSDHMDINNHHDSISNKQNRRGNKMLITSSSEDEHHSDSKLRKKPDMYTDSDSDHHIRSEKHDRHLDTSEDETTRPKSISRKGSKSRITSDTSEDEQLRKQLDKIKKERYSDSEVEQNFADSDEKLDIKHYKKPKEEKLNIYEEEKYNIKKEKKLSTKLHNMSDDETTRKMLTEAVKAEIYGDKDLDVRMENNRYNNDRLTMLCDVSSENETIHNIDNKKDLFGLEKSEIRKKHKKKQKRQKNSILTEDLIKVERLTDETENEQSNKCDETLEKIKISEKKKHSSKKDKKRDKVKDEDRIKEKSKKLKKFNKDINSKEIHNVLKREGKLEDIFGSFSDDSETGNKDSLMNSIGNKENNSFFVHLSDKLQSSHMYASDSDSIQHIDQEKEKLKEESRKRKEKKRKEKERRIREENENSVDFADLGKVLEDNLKDENISDNIDKTENVVNIKTEIEEEMKTEDIHNNSDVFRFSDDEEKKEIEKKEMKEKKKKRKKSKEEKQNRHHHHHHDKNQEKVEKIKSPDFMKKESTPILIDEIKEEPEIKQVQQQSSSLPNILDIPSPPQTKSTSSDFSVSPISREPLISPIPKTPTSSKTEKKRDKFIPGFGSEIDETIHETAVKSISDFGSPPLVEQRIEPEEIKTDDLPKSEKSDTAEDKPRVIISQEETEDAVAALLGESFGGGDFDDCYNESQSSPTNAENNTEVTNDEVTLVEDDEEMRQAVQSLNAADMEAKPDTPQSENDLQIDTDTDEGEEPVVRYEQSPRTPDMVDLSRPPKTPDYPSNYYRTEDAASKIQTPVLIKTSIESTVSQIKSPVSTQAKPRSEAIDDVRRNIEMSLEKPIIQPPISRPPPIEQKLPITSEQQTTRSVISQSWSLPIQKPYENRIVPETVEKLPSPEIRKSESFVPKYIEEIKPLLAKSTIVSMPTQTSTVSQQPATTVLTTQSKSYFVPPVIKISDHTSSHPTTVMSPKLESNPSPVKIYNSSMDMTSKISTTTTTSVPPVLTTVMSKPRPMPQQLPTTKPVRVQHAVISHLQAPLAKPQTSTITPNSGLLTTVVTSGNIQMNRLPITPIMQPATVLLPQSKIAVSTIQTMQKVVSSPEVSKHQEPPRMIYHTSGNITVPSYTYPQILSHSQTIPTAVPIRSTPPVGLLAPARHLLPPTSYSLPPTTRSVSPLVKEPVKSVIEKTLPVISEPQKPTNLLSSSHIYSQPSTTLHLSNIDTKLSTPVIQEVPTPKLVPLTTSTSEVRIPQHSIIQQAPSQKTVTSVQEIIRHPINSQVVPVSQSPIIQAPTIMASKPMLTTSNSTICPPVISHPVVTQPLPVISQTMATHTIISQPQPLVTQPVVSKSTICQPVISQSSISTVQALPHSSPSPVISHPPVSQPAATETPPILSPEIRTPVSVPQESIINDIPRIIKETISTRSTPSPVIVSTPKEHSSPVIVQEPTLIKKDESVDKENILKTDTDKPISEINLPVKNEPAPKEEFKQEPVEEHKVDTNTISLQPKPEIKIETTDTKPEIKLKLESTDVVSVIKETDHYEKEKQEDTESIISETKEGLSAEMGIKDDPLDSKEDSDYWSAKEVNIESVIKKVEALCSADELSEGSEAGKDDWYDNENKAVENEVKHEESICEKEPEKSSEECDTSDVTKTDAESEHLDESLDNNCEEKEISVRGSRRGGRMRGRKTKSDRTGVTTRRGKSVGTASRRGGRGGRTRNDKKIKQSESDVYEFHDDSDESKDRPRLILTIKSPAGASNNPSTPSAVIKETPQKPVDSREEFVSPAANTRKSRRIQERDGSRNTVDDIIEDVVRNVAVVTRSAAAAAQGLPSPRRSTRQNVLKLPPVVQEPRKSPRATRKKDRRVSDTTDDSSEEKSIKKEEPKPEIEPVKEENVEKELPKIVSKPLEKEKPKNETPPMGLKATVLRRIKGELCEEPTTLIDPVTGLLTQMRECEEGKYIPVSTTATSSSSSVITEVTAGKTVNAKVELPEPVRIVTSTIASTQPSVEQQITTSVITKPQPTVSVQPKPQSLKAHVLSSQAAKVVVSQTQVPKTATLQPVQQPSTFVPKPTVPINQNLNVNVSMATNMEPITMSPRQVVPKPIHVLPQPTKTLTASPMSPNQIAGTISNPKQHFLQAVNKQQQQQQLPSKPSTPVNPKAHLLNAVNQSLTTPGGTPPIVVNSTMAHVKSHIPQVPQAASLPSPVKQQVVVGNVAPIVKPHNLHVPQQILTGAVASPPLKHHPTQQPIVAGASSGRMGIPSSSPMPGISAKGAMDAQKVEVSMPGCVMISHPTVSPQAQARGQVLQAGMPVPAYEASLHGVGDHPLFSRQSPPPAHQQTSPAPQGEPMAHFPPGAVPLRSPHDIQPHHFMHSHAVYQQFLRAQQEARIPYHLPRSPMVSGGLEKTKDGQEGEEAPVTSPPLELRRPGSVGLTARPAAVPHSLQSPHDRATDSPQVAQVYMHQARIPHYHTPGRYYETPAEPPPAHRPVTSHMGLTAPGSSLGAAGNLTGAMARHTGAEAPASQRGLQVATPPHASQVPPQADSLLMLLKQYRIMWQGLLALKNDQAAVQMHFVFGNPHVARNSLPCNSDGSTPPLRIAQRMRLEKTQVEGVARKMQMENEHCVLLALPCGRDHMDVLQQSTNLSNGFITYLQQKEAAGIVNIAAPGSQHAAYVVHIFPSCDFVKENLARIAPNLLHRVADIAHLLIVIATV